MGRVNFELDTMILILEDHLGTQEWLSWIIQAAGFKPVQASSVEEALTAYAENQIQFIISDIDLGGGLSGIDFILQLKEQNQNVPPMVLYSGNADVEMTAQPFSSMILQLKTIFNPCLNSVRTILDGMSHI